MKPKKVEILYHSNGPYVKKSIYNKLIKCLKDIEADKNLNFRPHLRARKLLIELGEFDLKHEVTEDT